MSVLKRLDLTSKLLILGIIIALILPPIAGVKPHQKVSLPKYSTFSTRNTNPHISLQTFDSSKTIALNWFWDSGRSAALYLNIKNGNKLYDVDGSYCGYLLVKGDGSIVLKGWSTGNGHYYGVNGAKAHKK